MPRVYSSRWTTSRQPPRAVMRSPGRYREADPKRELRMHSLRPRHPDDSSQAPLAIQPEDGARPLSAQEEIRSLARRAVLDLTPLPPAMPIRRDPVILEAGSKGAPRTTPRPEKGTDRLLADHSEATSRPETSAGQTRVQARTPAEQPRDSGTADQSHGKDSGTAALRLRPRRQESSQRLRQGKDRTLQGGGGGCHFRNARSGLESVHFCTRIDVPTRRFDPLRPRSHPPPQDG